MLKASVVKNVTETNSKTQKENAKLVMLYAVNATAKEPKHVNTAVELDIRNRVELIHLNVFLKINAVKIILLKQILLLPKIILQVSVRVKRRMLLLT